MARRARAEARLLFGDARRCDFVWGLHLVFVIVVLLVAVLFSLVPVLVLCRRWLVVAVWGTLGDANLFRGR